MKTIPLTLACALIFWGYQTGYMMFACLMGVVIELARILNIRWNPSLDQINKISDTCTVCLASTILYFVSMDIEAALVNILRYLPVFGLPLIIVQEYSAAGNIDVRALYLFKKKITGNATAEAVRVNLSLAFIIICLISSAAAAENRQAHYYPVVLGIIAVVLFFQRPRGTDIRIWIAAMIVAATIGFFLQSGLHYSQRVMTRRAWYRLMSDSADPLRGATALGKIGPLKLSNKIVFRVIPSKNADRGTYLLKEAAYNLFSDKVWTAAQNKFELIPLSDDDEFITGQPTVSDYRDTGTDAKRRHPHLASQSIPNSADITILTRMKKPKGVLRLPENAIGVKCPTVSGVKTNGLGTFVVDDAPGFMRYDVRYGDPGTNILPPGKSDLLLPDQEQALFRNLAVELGFDPGKSPQLILSEIKKYFLTNFSYTLDLETDETTSTITAFMTRTRAGHCEYFATATVLLLRAAGIPARYVTGYMAFEKSVLSDKIVVRRKHAHAWAEVFVNGRWMFFDTTPPAWTNQEASHFLRTAIPDLFSLMGYGLAVLRWGNPETKKKLLWLLVPLGLLIIRRLLRKDKTKKENKLGHAQNHATSGAMPDTPDFYIRKLEEKLVRSGFSRKPHETYEQFFIRIKEKAFSQQDVPSLMTVIQIHKQLRFGPHPISSQKQIQLKTQTDRLIQKCTVARTNAKPMD
nr:transglutaminase family protein [uncultured Desulfobacter sp.]